MGAAKAVAVLTAFAAAASTLPLDGERRRYDGCELIRVGVESLPKLTALLEDGLISHSWFEEIRTKDGSFVDVMVHPLHKDDVKGKLAGRHSVIIPDVQALVDAQVPASREALRGGREHRMDWTSYHSLEDIYSYLSHLEKTYPDMVTVETIGRTHEDRELRLAKVCSTGRCGDKPGMWIDGGIHAREWVSPAVATYLLRELMENNATNSKLTEKLDWYVLPVMNPDGYEYTRSMDRLWRKNRSPNQGSQCKGTDLNRNFGYHFGEAGTSSKPCFDTYHGPGPFSELETQHVRDFLVANQDHVKFTNSMHSYSQLFLLPWGFLGGEMPPTFDQMKSLADKGNAALKAVHGKDYQVGEIIEIIGPAAGGSIDWILAETKIPYTYGTELRDTGEHGFLLPPDQIVPNGEEIFAFHKAVAEEIIEQFA